MKKCNLKIVYSKAKEENKMNNWNKFLHIVAWVSFITIMLWGAIMVVVG